MKKKSILFVVLFYYCCPAFCLSIKHAPVSKVVLKADSFIKIGRSEIYFNVKGTGPSSVVFVSGLGDDHATWHIVQDSVSKYALTLSYDRSGLGKSAYNGEKKDLVSMTQELNTLVRKLNIPRPFIIVGHSLGCQIVKEYCLLYPMDIKGVVFCDPGYNEDKLRAAIPDSLWRLREATLKKYLPVFSDAQNAELKNVNKAAAMSDAIKALKNVPIVLFTATHVNADFPASAMEFKIKNETHLLWLQSLPWAKHIMVPESRHYVQEDAPQRVVAAVSGMLK